MYRTTPMTKFKPCIERGLLSILFPLNLILSVPCPSNIPSSYFTNSSCTSKDSLPLQVHISSEDQTFLAQDRTNEVELIRKRRDSLPPLCLHFCNQCSPSQISHPILHNSPCPWEMVVAWWKACYPPAFNK